MLGHLSNPITKLVWSLAGAKGRTENQKLEMGPPSSSGSAPVLFQRDVSPEGSPYNRAKELEKPPVPHLFGNHSLGAEGSRAESRAPALPAPNFSSILPPVPPNSPAGYSGPDPLGPAAAIATQ